MSLRVKRSNLTLIREIATHLSGARNDIPIKHSHGYHWICACIVSIFCVATILLPTLAVSPPLHAETLEDAWNIALSNDHRLQASRMNVDSGRQSLSAAKSARFPVLSLESGYTILNNAPAARLDEPMAVLDRIPTAEDKSLYYKTTLTLPFYTGGRISTEIDAAITNLNTAVQDEMKTILDLKLDVAEAYISVLRARRLVQVAEANVSSLASYADDVKNFYEQGMVTKMSCSLHRFPSPMPASG
jgi:outer membrane protein